MGLPGIVVLTALGNANIPVPSEAVLPFGGLLAQKGTLNFHMVALAGTLGSVAGSLISYGAGRFLGPEFLQKYGKFVLMRTHEIERAEEWFQKHGLFSTFWGRFIPIVRSFVSLPAGIFRSNLALFTLYAVMGSLPWCYAWTYLGFSIGSQWSKIEKYSKILDFIVLGALILLIARFLIKRFRNHTAASG